MSDVVYVITDLEHTPLGGETPCADCVALASRALDIAMVNGSVGAAHSVNRNGYVDHSATVHRSFGTVDMYM